MDYQQQYQDLIHSATVFINGKDIPAHEASISVFDRGFLYGDSIYEVCYGLDGQLIFFQEHLERLYHSAELLAMQIHLSKNQIIDQIMGTLKHANLKNVYLRAVLTRGESIISLDPNTSFHNNFITIAKPLPTYPATYYQQGIHLHLTEVLRNNPKAVDPNAKSGNYLNNVMALEDAKKHKAVDAIMLNQAGEVTEGTTFNIWIVKDGVYITPPLKSGLLAGITRKNIISLAKAHNLKLKEEVIRPENLYAADEVFITSSTRKIIPVNRIKDKVYGESIKDWPCTEIMMAHYQTLIENQPREYQYL